MLRDYAIFHRCRHFPLAFVKIKKLINKPRCEELTNKRPVRLGTLYLICEKFENKTYCKYITGSELIVVK